MFTFIDYKPEFREIRSTVAENIAEAKKKFLVPPCLERYNRKGKHEDNIDGDTRLANLRGHLSVLDGKGYRRSTQQHQFQEGFIAACVKQLYGSEYIDNVERINKTNGWDQCKQGVAITAPRRVGKTYAVGGFCAAWIATQPSTSIIIFSTGKRASSKMLQTIKDMYAHFGFPKEWIIRSSEEVW